MAKTFRGKLEHGRVHDWERIDMGRSVRSLCGLVQPREFVTKKGFQWPRCQRCEGIMATAPGSAPEGRIP